MLCFDYLSCFQFPFPHILVDRDALWDNDSCSDIQSIADTVNSEISELTDEWDDDEEDLQEVTELTDSRKYIVYQSALIELYKQVRTSTL